MTHDEMIAAILADKNKQPIQSRERGKDVWLPTHSPCWNFNRFEYRPAPTPIPPGDLTWEEAIELRKHCVEVQYLSKSDGDWHNCDGFNTLPKGYAYRRTPVPRKVHLGPEDVPPGSVVKHPKWTNDIWSYCQPKNRCLFVVGYGEFLYEIMQSDGWLIKRPGQDWMRCEKDEVAQ